MRLDDNERGCKCGGSKSVWSERITDIRHADDPVLIQDSGEKRQGLQEAEGKALRINLTKTECKVITKGSGIVRYHFNFRNRRI